MLNVDCQIRGKSDIHEALAMVTEVEVMEGSNQVFCDRCKQNRDTVLRTAISTLPNMMILSLKRFDLDYNTFETVKLNSRCAFGQTLNMKRYTLEGLEAMEQAGVDSDENGAAPMDTSSGVAMNDPLSKLPDEDYEYKLAGVLVHAGVAQGGHYYSFIKDRNTGSKDQWYRYDDEDVTPFDPASIEVECFGGKVKKETKWPNGQVHTWSLHYQPEEANGRGRMTLTFDGETHVLDMKEGHRAKGAHLDRFGIFDLQAGGHHVEIYLDELSYSK